MTESGYGVQTCFRWEPSAPVVVRGRNVTTLGTATRKTGWQIGALRPKEQVGDLTTRPPDDVPTARR